MSKFGLKTHKFGTHLDRLVHTAGAKPSLRLYPSVRPDPVHSKDSTTVRQSVSIKQPRPFLFIVPFVESSVFKGDDCMPSSGVAWGEGNTSSAGSMVY